LSSLVFVASEFISAFLALILVYLFAKAYRIIHTIYLLGLPLGFSFLMSSYLFLGISMFHETSNVTISESFMWLRIVTQSFGFVFIAFTYYFSSKGERNAKNLFLVISFVSILSVFLITFGAAISASFLGTSTVDVVDEILGVANLVFVGYIIYYLSKGLKSLLKEEIAGVLWTPSAFILLWLAQYSLLIGIIDGGQIAFALAHVSRLASLLLFIHIYYLPGRIHPESTETW
jgi:hypothetical protein